MLGICAVGSSIFKNGCVNFPETASLQRNYILVVFLDGVLAHVVVTMGVYVLLQSIQKCTYRWKADG